MELQELKDGTNGNNEINLFIYFVIGGFVIGTIALCMVSKKIIHKKIRIRSPDSSML